VVGFAETPDTDPPVIVPLFTLSFGTKVSCRTWAPLPGATRGASEIKPEGQVVGFAETSTADPNNPPFLESRAFLWEEGLMTDLGTLGGSDGFAASINEVGQAGGGANVNDTVVPPFTAPPFFAFLWQNGVMTNLGAMGGNRKRRLWYQQPFPGGRRVHVR
jgi:probable HAF family extracellular repeat protein